MVLYHAGFGGATGGFIGVDVFFVISGHLIARIISDELSSGEFSIIGFHDRRVRRIIPALIVPLVGCLIIGWFILFSDDLDQLDTRKNTASAIGRSYKNNHLRGIYAGKLGFLRVSSSRDLR